MERDVVYGETWTVTKIQAREGVEDLRSVYTPFVQSGEAFSTIIDRCDNSSPSPSPFFMQTEKKGPLGAYPVSAIMLLMSNAVSSMATWKVGYVFRRKSIIWHEKFSERSALACEQVVKGQRRVRFVVNPATRIAALSVCFETEIERFENP